MDSHRGAPLAFTKEEEQPGQLQWTCDDGKEMTNVELPTRENDLMESLPCSISFSADTSFKETPGRPRWTKPLKPWDTVYRAGEEVSLAVDDGPKWSSDELPPEVDSFNFTSLEDGMRRLANVTDDWTSDYLADVCVDLDMHSNCAVGRHPVDMWWLSGNPAIRPELVPFVKDHMSQQETTPSCDMDALYQQSLGLLRNEGSDRMAQRAAAAALIMWSERHPRAAGKALAQTVGRGDRYPCIDYVAQELSIGNLYFLCIDMGYELPLGLHTQNRFWGTCEVGEEPMRVCTSRTWYGMGGAR